MKQWLSKLAISLVAVVAGTMFFVWYRVTYRAIDPGLEEGIRTVVQRNPALQPLLDRAMADGILTMAEANMIIDAAEKSKSTPQ